MWLEKPFTKGQAWVDLLMLANHQDRKILLGNRTVTIQRGQIHTSELKLADRWGWGRKKVRAYLSLLENEKMATTIGTTQGTTITVENYASFQGVGPTKDTTIGTSEEHRRNNGGTAEGTQTRKKERKECKEGEEIYNSLPPELRDPFKEFLEHRKQIKKPMSDHAVTLMLKKLVEMSGGETETAKQILEQSIVNGWVGIFPLKEKPKGDLLTEIIKEGMRSGSDRNSQDYEDHSIAVRRP
jgi:hypothetical protein